MSAVVLMGITALVPTSRTMMALTLMTLIMISLLKRSVLCDLDSAN